MTKGLPSAAQEFDDTMPRWKAAAYERAGEVAETAIVIVLCCVACVCMVLDCLLGD